MEFRSAVPKVYTRHNVPSMMQFYGEGKFDKIYKAQLAAKAASGLLKHRKAYAEPANA
jgi:hypothetical protein